MEDSTTINSIPKLLNDVIIEILTRLPVKPLLKFKCVCKSWLSLISSKEFIKTHLRYSKKYSNITQDKIILKYHGNLKQFSVRSLLDEPTVDELNTDTDCSITFPKKFGCVGSCDGLICLVTYEKDLILWNPSTRICKKLPDFGVETNFGSYFVYGFGFDKSSDDYKFVGFLHSKSDFSEVIVKVYSLKSDKWRRIKNFTGRRLMNDPATFANGKLHWITNSDLELESGFHVVSLDLQTEEYGIIEIPNYVKSGIYSRMGLSEGRLYVLCSHETSAEVWIMSDYDGVGLETWSKVVTIPYIDDFLKYTYKTPLYVLKNGEIVLLCGTKLVIFDSKDCSFRYPEVRNMDGLVAAGTYFESLVSPLG